MILNRKLKANKKRIFFSRLEKLFYAILYKLSDKSRAVFTLVQPETVLKWYHNFLKKRWRYPAKNKKVGRPQTPKDVKLLILRLKNENLLWGCKRIQGELLKLGLELDKKTIRNIIADFRRKGKIKSAMTWRQFIKAHLDSLYAMDFFTVDSIFGFRYYVFFIIYLRTREIVKFRITRYPSKFFVQQQLMDWRWDKEEEKVYLIHDNDPLFVHIDFSVYGIRNVPTSVKAPNMNCFAERFVKSARVEALDNFIIFSEKQLENILQEYIKYYNKQRPHQGLEQEIPGGYAVQREGKVVSFPVLSGLHHHYERRKVS